MNNKGSALKIILAVVITIIVVVALIIVWALWYSSVDKEVETIGIIESDFTKNYNLFSTEYPISDPIVIESIAGVPRALEANILAKKYIANAEANATEIVKLSEEAKVKFKDDKLEWINKVNGCYNKRIVMMDNYQEVLSNEEKQLIYLNYSFQFDLTYQEFTSLLASYLLYSKSNDKQNIIKTLNEMKPKVLLMRSQLENMNNAISLSSVGKLIEWTKKYDELIDLSIRFWNAQTLEQEPLSKQILQKGVEAGALLNEGSAKLPEEADSWKITNVKNKQDIAGRSAIEANNICNEAYRLYTQIYPSANAVNG